MTDKNPMLVFAAIMPHPPESIEGIGNAQDFAEISKTLQAFETLRLGLEAADAQTIIIISPHGRLEPYSFVINSDPKLRGSFDRFGLDKVLSFENNLSIADKICFACTVDEELPCLLREDSLDHGSLIPLHHLTKNISPKIVHLSFSLLSYQRHYRYGEIIRQIIDNPKSGRVAVIASGELSHRLTSNSLSGFSPQGSMFDHSIIRFLGSKDLADIMNLEPEIVDEVRECGLRSIIILLGILHGKEYDFELLSYEGPSGIGYLTARLL